MDREEFTSFYAASFPRLVGQLYAMTGDRAEAQDAVQAAFVRAWVHRGQIDTDRGAEAWVRVTAWRIAASRCGAAYVANLGSGTVTPIQTATNTALPGLKIGYSGPIAITP